MSDSQNLVDEAYNRLRTIVCTDRLLKTRPLSIARLARELGMSRTPVRLGLERLQTRGLVQYTDEAGWVTVPLRLDDVKEIVELADVLELLIIRKVAETINVEDAAELLSVVGEMEQAAEAGDVAAWTRADRSFHRLTYRVAGSNRLNQMLAMLSDEIDDLLRRFNRLEGRLALSTQEHRAIAEALAGRDPTAAAQAQADHMSRTVVSLMDVLTNMVVPLVEGSQSPNAPVSPVDTSGTGYGDEVNLS